jgi:anti-anti-sigma factor
MNMPDEPFALTVETAGPAAIVAVSGEVDVATAPQLDECLVRLACGSITVDCSAVTFMDSSCFAVVVNAHKRAKARGKEFRVTGVSGTPLRAMEVLGLEYLMNGQQPESS